MVVKEAANQRRAAAIGQRQPFRLRVSVSVASDCHSRFRSMQTRIPRRRGKRQRGQDVPGARVRGARVAVSSEMLADGRLMLRGQLMQAVVMTIVAVHELLDGSSVDLLKESLLLQVCNHGGKESLCRR